MNARAWMVFGLLFIAGRMAAADPPYYARQATWQETLRTAREGLARFEAEAARQRQTPAKPDEPVWGPWYAYGPVGKEGETSFAAVLPPEQGVDLHRVDADGRLRWVKHPEWQDGVVTMLQAGTQEATYLFRTITAPRALTLTGYFGSDDGLIVWLNGKRILANDVPRGVTPNQDTAPLALVPGENRLLLKICNQTGDHGFYFSTSPTPAPSTGADARAELWALVERDFPTPEARRQMRRERADGIWEGDWEPGEWSALASRYAAATRIPFLAPAAKSRASQAKDAAGLQAARALYHRSRNLEEALARLRHFNSPAVRRAIADLSRTYGKRYPKGQAYLARLARLEKARQTILTAGEKADRATLEQAPQVADDLEKLRAEALLANPLLNFERLLVVKRRADLLGLPQNWQGNSSIPRTGYDNEIALLSPVGPGGKLTTLFRPEGGRFVGDIDLHFDGRQMLFSMPDERGRWQVFEIGSDGSQLRQVTPGNPPDVDNFDACYLPNGKVIFCSTACFQGVPCVAGADHVSLLYLLDRENQRIRQLTFDQDHNWCPTLLNNGKVLYTRWEYSDTPHYFTRLLFHMNPDGTEQAEYYGSNSYWPNSIFYARPIPGHPTQVVAIVSGHHGVPRMGELVLFDPARGRREGDGVVQRIPGYGKKVEPIIQDQLVEGSWPKFLHPWPLSDRYFLVSCKPNPDAPWGIYLADTFDNLVPLAELEGYALFEPIPLRPHRAPIVVPERVQPERKDALVYLADVYQGDGLKGVPRGAVKALRVYANHYAYPNMGGHIHIGIDGPWDVKRILGTVPVRPDGSALFRVPANTPLVVQPLDAEGKALQVMRSWMTAMPGETLSCVGCHEPQNSTPTVRDSEAARSAPVEITPWYGPTRGFSFEREVQPVLDHYCVRCHGEAGTPPDLRGLKARPDYRGRFTPAYEALHRYVRRPGPESDYHLPIAAEYHADTSELVQLLQKGHYGVVLNREAWDRLITWIDLNVPCHGTWHEHQPIPNKGDERRRALRLLYAGIDEDPEAVVDLGVRISDVAGQSPQPPESGGSGVAQPPQPPKPGGSQIGQVPKSGGESSARLARLAARGAGTPPSAIGKPESLDLGGGITLELVTVPAGEFVMGDAAGYPDEQPPVRVRIARPFAIGKLEVTNEQFRRFDPTHDSGVANWLNKDQYLRGYPLNGPKQPVVRVSWDRAMAFCRWLSQRTGRRVSLPTEAQWEYACRAGTTTPLWYGDLETDFSASANLADASLSEYYRADSPDWLLKEPRFRDGALVTADVGSFRPNPWGLHDMHGNVCEWTRTLYHPQPGGGEEGAAGAAGRRVVRGGSWTDRPRRARSAFRLSYPQWQGVHNVGFRVVCE